MKQIIKNILTILLGHKYFIIVYQIKTKFNLQIGNMNLKVTRLTQPDSDYIREQIFKRNECDRKDIIITNIIRVGKMENKFS